MSVVKVKCRCCDGRGTTDIPDRLEQIFRVMPKTSRGKCCKEIVEDHYKNTGEVIGHTTMFQRLNRLVKFGLLTRKKTTQASGGVEYIFFKEFD